MDTVSAMFGLGGILGADADLRHCQNKKKIQNTYSARWRMSIVDHYSIEAYSIREQGKYAPAFRNGTHMDGDSKRRFLAPWFLNLLQETRKKRKSGEGTCLAFSLLSLLLFPRLSCRMSSATNMLTSFRRPPLHRVSLTQKNQKGVQACLIVPVGLDQPWKSVKQFPFSYRCLAPEYYSEGYIKINAKRLDWYLRSPSPPIFTCTANTGSLRENYRIKGSWLGDLWSVNRQ